MATYKFLTKTAALSGSLAKSYDDKFAEMEKAKAASDEQEKNDNA
jgi:hypothetical protein